MKQETFAKLCGFKYLDYILSVESTEIVRELAKSSPLDILCALEIAHQNGALEALNELTGRARQTQMEWLERRQSALRVMDESGNGRE